MSEVFNHNHTIIHTYTIYAHAAAHQTAINIFSNIHSYIHSLIHSVVCSVVHHTLNDHQTSLQIYLFVFSLSLFFLVIYRNVLTQLIAVFLISFLFYPCYNAPVVRPGFALQIPLSASLSIRNLFYAPAFNTHSYTLYIYILLPFMHYI